MDPRVNQWLWWRNHGCIYLKKWLATLRSVVVQPTEKEWLMVHANYRQPNGRKLQLGLMQSTRFYASEIYNILINYYFYLVSHPLSVCRTLKFVDNFMINFGIKKKFSVIFFFFFLVSVFQSVSRVSGWRHSRRWLKLSSMYGYIYDGTAVRTSQGWTDGPSAPEELRSFTWIHHRSGQPGVVWVIPSSLQSSVAQRWADEFTTRLVLLSGVQFHPSIYRSSTLVRRGGWVISVSNFEL